MTRRGWRVLGVVLVVWAAWLIGWTVVWGMWAFGGDLRCPEYRGSSVYGKQRWTAVPLAPYCDYAGMARPDDDPRLAEIWPNREQAGTGTLLLQLPLVVLPLAAVGIVIVSRGPSGGSAEGDEGGPVRGGAA